MAKNTSRQANPNRGELSLTLGGRDYTLRPSFEAIEAFEAGTGKGLMELTGLALAGKISLSETATIACECIRAQGRATNSVSLSGSQRDKIAEMILESGFQDALVVMAGMLALAVSGGVTASGELKAATKTTTPTTDAPPAAA